ncbi:hypothetical protein PRUPE_7G092900 [Prunus persica]|uniref:MADS-box domain-containing protein n=1 Tax=Prunus persica TaxID=3760 RepID=A0A251N954_PRUPE|nr:MADS-box protein SOC1 [Prunus persica]ONH95863.1 hypothetical protein PRUPE_7G092900 [Prunus persica]
MTRRKVKLAWIVNDAARKATFRKRRANLLKKLRELTILCDVNGLIIVYGPDSDEPVVWPERPVVQELLARFLSIPEFERWKKMTNQETYLKDSAAKIQEQIRKIQKKNNEMEMNYIMHQILKNGKPLDAFHARELTDLVFFMKDKMKEIEKRIETKEMDPNVPPCAPPHNDEWNATESLFNYLHKEKTKQMENIVGASSSVRSDMGLPEYTYFGSSVNPANGIGFPSVNFEGNYSYGGSDLGLPKQIHNIAGSSSSVRHYGTDLGMPHVNYGGSSTGGSEMRHDILPHYYGDNIVGNTGWGTRETNAGYGDRLGHLPQQLSVEGDKGSGLGLPAGLFGGNNGGSDAGLPYDVTKT